MTTPTVDALHERIAKILGWKIPDCRNFSLKTLRELIREKNPRLARQIQEVVDSGEHLFHQPEKKRRRW